MRSPGAAASCIAPQATRAQQRGLDLIGGEIRPGIIRSGRVHDPCRTEQEIGLKVNDRLVGKPGKNDKARV
jgi:hypothetical protein